MGKKQYLFVAAAPLALACLGLTPSEAAEIKTRSPSGATAPRIKTSVPAEVKNEGRIRTVVTPAEEEAAEAEPTEERRSAEEAKPAPIRRNRAGTTVINTSSPAEAKDTPRIRSRVPVSTDDEAVAIDSTEAEPAASRKRTRIDNSAPPEIETQPRVRTRVATPVEEQLPAEQKTPRRLRTGTPPIDDASPVETENRPYARKRVATPAEEVPAPDVEGPVAQRRRARIESNIPVIGSEPSAPPPRTARIDDDGGSKIKRDFVGKVRSGAVVLKPGSHEKILSGLKVIRTLDLAALTASPTVTLGGTLFDFNPMLQNPESIPNIAKKLRAMPKLVDVRPNSGQLIASQTDRGFVIRSELAYSLKPGACRTAANRALIAKAGISCFVYKNPAAREAAFADPNAVEYVENASARAKAIANARAQADATAADIAANISEFRAMLKDPSQRAEMAASAGEDEIARMEQLDDTALAGELANLHEVEIQETGFMPILNPDLVIDPSIFANRKAAEERANKLIAADAQLAAPTKASSYQIADQIFLTGFTLGSKDEWRKSISTTIRWCFVGCKRTYYVEAWAGFEYGFGLRFPMKFGGTYHYDPANGGKARLEPTLTMFDGNADDYRKTGLPENKVFNGKEFVAGFGANAGFAANLPFSPLINPPELNPKLDLTELEQFPFKGGNVAPPNPGGPEPSADVIFRDVDLLNNYANLGFVAVKIHPAVQVGLTSNGMSLRVNDTQIDNSTKSVPLSLDSGHISSFTAKDPSYNIGLTLTPGLEARVTLDLAVWSTSLEWPVWLTAAKITLPPGGKTFACHDGTSCSRDFTLSPDGVVSPFKRDLKNWGVSFDAKWLPKCVDAICTTSVKLKRFDTIEWGLAQELESPNIKLDDIKPQLSEAQDAAIKYANESVARKAQTSSDTSAAMSNVALAVYIPQCKDSLCVDNITALAAQMGPRAKEIILYKRHLDPAEVNKMVNKEFGPKFVAEVDASKQRAQMKQAGSVLDQAKKTGKQPKLPR